MVALPYEWLMLRKAAHRLRTSTASVRRKLRARASASGIEGRGLTRSRYCPPQAGSLGIDTIALECGFSEGSAFRRAFKRWMNCAPGGYRRRVHAGRPRKGDR